MSAVLPWVWGLFPTAQWSTVRDTGGEAQEDAQPHGSAGSSEAVPSREVHLKLCTLEGGRGYAALALSQDYTEAWVVHCDGAALEALIKRDLPRIYIAPVALTKMLSETLGPAAPRNSSAKVRLAQVGVLPERALHITVTKRLTTAAEQDAGPGDAGVALSWTLNMAPLSAEQLTRHVLAPLVIRPLLGASVGLAHSHDMLQNMNIAKDRALHTFVQTYGGHDVKRIPPPLQPEAYYPSLFASRDWSAHVRSATLSHACSSGSTGVTLPVFFGTASDVQRTQPEAPEASKHTGCKRALDDADAVPAVGAVPTETGGDDAPPLAQEGSYVETEEERQRREQITQKLTQKKVPALTGVGQQAKKRQKVRNAFT